LSGNKSKISRAKRWWARPNALKSWPRGPGKRTGRFRWVDRALREIGYDGYLAMEIGFNRRDVEPDLVARQAFNYLKPLVS
jgi:hypothetical protein